MLTMKLRRVRGWFSFRSPLESAWALMCRHIQHVSRKEMLRLSTIEGAAKLGVKDYYCRLAKWLPPANVAPDTTVLELGCGPGRYVGLLNGLGHKLVAVDPMRFPEWELFRARANIAFHDKVYAEDLPFADRSFDHLVCLGTLLYVNDPTKSLAEMHRVLKPGGTLIVRTVNRLNYRSRWTGKPIDPASKNLYDMDELTAALRNAGFDVQDKYAYGLMLPLATGYYWYCVCCWFPYWFQDLCSFLTPERSRWNNIVLAKRPSLVSPLAA